MDALKELIEHGQSYWIDNLSRDMIRDGELQRRVEEEGLRGVTSNPKIFSKAISHGERYDEQIAEMVANGAPVGEIYEALVVTDIQDACDLLRPVYDDTEGADGFVSLEVSPYLAHDTEASADEARRLFAAVDRPNVLIKIPGTPAGVPAIEQMLYEGVNINITLLFSIAAYEAVAEAYVRALERRVQEGLAIDRIASVASFFLSRIDVLADELLGQRIRPRDSAGEGPRPELLLGKVATASAKLAYQSFRRIFSGKRWEKLAAGGARVQRVLWASTSTKNPLYSDVKYVEPLIGPHTVNTLPDRTIRAFADHGRVADTIEEALDESRRVLADLEALGIDLPRITDRLIDEGVQKFIDPYDDLLGTLAQTRHGLLGTHAVRQSIEAGELSSKLESVLDGLDGRQLGRRLFQKDPYLWSAEERDHEVIRNRLGWLDAPEAFAELLNDITAFAAGVRDDGITAVVHLGMGGSSLCPAVCAQIFGPAEGWPELIVLDDTDPAAVAAVEERIDPARTLFIVASKSGTTTETLSFDHYFYERIAAAGVEEPGSRFVAITDAGTPLEAEARERSFRRVFTNPEDIGGRYSALSYFGLVPMALLGIDLDEMLAAARQMRLSCGPEVPAAHNPGIELGAALGVAARAGRDKVTFAFSPAIAPFGLWLEQLIAESTGKRGRGLVPVVDEPLGEPSSYGDDRIFVLIRIDGSGDGGGSDDGDQDIERRLQALQEGGHPVVRIELADRIGLGAEMFHWEMATATAGAIVGVDAFDEPDVADSKRNTRELLQEWERDGKLHAGEPLAQESGLALWADPRALGDPEEREDADGSVSAFLKRFLHHAHDGDYVALLPYFRPTEERARALDAVRDRLRNGAGNGARLATTLGYGPRYLHSTGQLHKGGPDSGVFLLITADADDDTPIPGEPYGFATLQRAQALGDYRALVDRGRRVVRIDLGDDPEAGLEKLEEAFS